MECRREADVVFVIDSTSNLLEKDFQLYILGTIAEIIQHLDVDLGKTRVAAVYFTNTAKVHFPHSRFNLSKRIHLPEKNEFSHFLILISNTQNNCNFH